MRKMKNAPREGREGLTRVDIASQAWEVISSISVTEEELHRVLFAGEYSVERCAVFVDGVEVLSFGEGRKGKLPAFYVPANPLEAIGAYLKFQVCLLRQKEVIRDGSREGVIIPDRGDHAPREGREKKIDLSPKRRTGAKYGGEMTYHTPVWWVRGHWRKTPSGRRVWVRPHAARRAGMEVSPGLLAVAEQPAAYRVTASLPREDEG